MGEQLGDEAGDDFREMVDQLEAGEMPDDAGGPPGDGPGFGADMGADVGMTGVDPFD
jgi:hypothetical protein